jgi:DNA helicase-2/ATP-dependent DNA helicase PcrA
VSQILAPKYVQRLRRLGVVDFEELLLRPLRMMQENEALAAKVKSRFDFLMVDEFQDTNVTQMHFVDQLSETHRNIAVVGDDDQSIYGWRGAEIQNILGFPKRYKNCKVIRLERNYRSTPSILNLANAIIKSNQARHEKVLKASLDLTGERPELFVFANEEAEVEEVVKELRAQKEKGFRWRDMAVLYRSNSQGGLMEGGLRRAQVPYKLTGGTALFDRKEAKDVLAFLRSCLYPNEVAFRRVINLPARGIGDKSVETIENTVGRDFYHRSKKWVENHPGDRAAEALSGFFLFLENLKTRLISGPESAETILNDELRKLGYRDYVNQSYRDLKAADARWLCVTILGRILDTMFERNGRSLATLEKFMDLMELRDAPDEKAETADEVQMMTLHACKGLEFPLVILLGLEEDLLPHARLGQNTDEERRLFYVGVTRAQKHLILTRVETRKRYGQVKPVSPSRFLLELDASLYHEMRGGRPLAVGVREKMLAELYQKLNKQMGDRQT